MGVGRLIGDGDVTGFALGQVLEIGTRIKFQHVAADRGGSLGRARDDGIGQGPVVVIAVDVTASEHYADSRAVFVCRAADIRDGGCVIGAGHRDRDGGRAGDRAMGVGRLIGDGDVAGFALGQVLEIGARIEIQHVAADRGGSLGRARDDGIGQCAAGIGQGDVVAFQVGVLTCQHDLDRAAVLVRRAEDVGDGRGRIAASIGLALNLDSHGRGADRALAEPDRVGECVGRGLALG